jgi:hypothetical protein
VLVALDVLAIVGAGVSTARALDDVRGFDLRFATREVGEKNFFFVAVFARETKIPLSGGKGVHVFVLDFLLQKRARGTGLKNSGCSYTARRLRASSENRDMAK